MWLAVRTAIFTLLVPGSVTVWVPYLLFCAGAARPARVAGGPWLAGLLPIAVGLAIYFWCAWDFASAGRGTPGPWDAPRVFVSRGLYRWTRNPMYVGVSLILIGEAFLFRSLGLLIYAAIVGALFNLFVILYEEPALRHRFGASYDEYCRRVPRWVRYPARSEDRG